MSQILIMDYSKWNANITNLAYVTYKLINDFIQSITLCMSTLWYASQVINDS